VNDAFIQEFVEQEILSQRQVEAVRIISKQNFLHQHDSGRVKCECWGSIGP
jgi:hypothetical protein